MWQNPQKTTDLATFTEKILNGFLNQYFDIFKWLFSFVFMYVLVSQEKTNNKNYSKWVSAYYILWIFISISHLLSFWDQMCFRWDWP